MLRRLPPLVLVLAFFVSVPALGQPTRLMEDVLGAGEAQPVARLLFHQDEDALCLTLGIGSGPEAINPNFFSFRRAVRPKDAATGRLKFKLPKEPEEIRDGFKIWNMCTESAGRVEEAEEDVIEITIRRSNSMNEVMKLMAVYPAADEASGMDVKSDGGGGLIGEGVLRPLT